MRTIVAFLAGWGLACVAMNYTRHLDRRASARQAMARRDGEQAMWDMLMGRQP